LQEKAVSMEIVTYTKCYKKGFYSFGKTRLYQENERRCCGQPQQLFHS
jgi:hypothetical protein